MHSTKAILVLGMHRSGTSATARTLNLLGAELGTHLLEPGDDNAKGFWEHSDAVDINDLLLSAMGRSWDDIRALPEGWETSSAGMRAVEEIRSLVRREFHGSPLWAVKDPRLCRVVPVWVNALSQEQVEPLFLFVMRHPAEVAQSLAKRDGISLEFGYALWLRYVTESEMMTRGHRRVMIHYDDLLRDWRGCVNTLSRSLGIDLMPEQNASCDREIDNYLNPGDRHHWVAPSGPLAPPAGMGIEDAAAAAYQTSLVIGTGKGNWGDLQIYGHALDSFCAGLSKSSLALLGMLQQSRARQFHQKVRYEQALSALNAELSVRDEAIARLETLVYDRLAEIEVLNGRLAKTDHAFARVETLAYDRLKEIDALNGRLAKMDQALAEATSLALSRLEQLQHGRPE
jgi:hypothetical protein